MSPQSIEYQIKASTVQAVENCYGVVVDPDSVIVNPTPSDFEGQFTVVVFPFVKVARKKPEAVGAEIGAALLKHLPGLASHNTVKGFLNLSFQDAYWVRFLQDAAVDGTYGRAKRNNQVVALEYCGPNTNKPLHLGHIRNMLLGWSVAALLDAAGNEVHKVNIYNDRGIAICKSMAAYLHDGSKDTPDSTGEKGDHLVGRYYVRYNSIITEQLASANLPRPGEDAKAAEKETAIYTQAQDLLRRWESGEEETLALWRRMNSWVYAGFNKTYAAIGVDFEKDYHESDTYSLGKTLVEEGLDSGAFRKHGDGSVRVDLSEDGLDEKILLRSDGTSVYITQDLGTAQLRYEDFRMDRSIYVVGSEQEYHFKVLKVVLQKLGKPYADGIMHLSYGMVDLPSGKMKSREGTTVDADDLVASMIATAAEASAELGKTAELNETEREALHRTIALGALKYFILKVDPRKRILFNPEESIDLHGNTGPFIQYSYARIRSLLRKAGQGASAVETAEEAALGAALGVGEGAASLVIPVVVDPERALETAERDLLLQLYRYPGKVLEAASNQSPAEIAIYSYDLAKRYNRFYTDCPVLSADRELDRAFRLALSAFTARVLRDALGLLGINAPQRM